MNSESLGQNDLSFASSADGQCAVGRPSTRFITKEQKPIRLGNIPSFLQYFSQCGGKKHCANSLQSCDS